MKKISIILALVLTFTLIFTACGEKESGGITENPTGGNGDSATQTVSGMNGESYSLSKNITKVVSLSPSASIIIDALGAGTKLVGVDAESAEVISTTASVVEPSGAAALTPEVIIVDEENASRIGETDIPVYSIPTITSSADIRALLNLTAKICGANAASLVDHLTQSINVAQLGSSEYSTKLTAYIDLGDGKTVGSGTYMTELLYAAGLESAAKDSEGFVEWTTADIVAANPQFIFTTGNVDDYLNNAELADVDAVVKGQVYGIEKKDIGYPTHRVADVTLAMYEAVSNSRADE